VDLGRQEFVSATNADTKHQKLPEYPAGTLNALNAAPPYVDPTDILHGGI
jgi:hypothetical protein